MRSHLVVTTAAADPALAPIEALRVAAGLASDDDSRDDELEALGLRVAAEIVEACGIRVGDGAEPTLRRERLTETFYACDERVLILARRHGVEIVSVTEDGIAVTLDARGIHAEAGLLERWVDGARCRWRADEVIVVYDAGFETVPATLSGIAADLARVRLAEAAVDPLEKSREVEIPDVERVRIDRWVGAVPGTIRGSGLPPGFAERLARFDGRAGF